MYKNVPAEILWNIALKNKPLLLKIQPIPIPRGFNAAYNIIILKESSSELEDFLKATPRVHPSAHLWQITASEIVMHSGN